MNYELAKQLKEAGFPQREANNTGKFPQYTGYGCGFVYPATGGLEEAYVPTLDELIEACPKKKDFALHELTNGKYAASILAHNPETEIVFGANRMSELGSTPKEAVARLWLALKKKV